MNRIVLALSSRAPTGRAPEVALNRARALEAELIALYVVDDRSIGLPGRRLAEQGFVGEKPCAGIASAAADQWQRCGEEILAEVEAAAGQAGVPCRSELAAGDLVRKALEVITSSEATLCVLPAERRSRVARWFRPDEAERLDEAQEHCQILVVHEQPSSQDTED